jgi:hypothetical protein
MAEREEEESKKRAEAEEVYKFWMIS